MIGIARVPAGAGCAFLFGLLAAGGCGGSGSTSTRTTAPSSARTVNTKQVEEGIETKIGRAHV